MPAIVLSRCARLQPPFRGWLLLRGPRDHTGEALTDEDAGMVGY